MALAEPCLPVDIQILSEHDSRGGCKSGGTKSKSQGGISDDEREITDIGGGTVEIGSRGLLALGSSEATSVGDGVADLEGVKVRTTVILTLESTAVVRNVTASSD